MSAFDLGTVFATVAAAVPDTECLVWRDRRLTYSQVDARANRFAQFLVSKGLGAHKERSALEGHESGQDHIALYLTNGNPYVEAMIGAYKARVAPFNVNYRYVTEELHYLFDNADTRAIVYGSSFAATLAEVLPLLKHVDVLIQVDEGDGTPLLPGAIDYEEALATMPDTPPAVTPSPDDLYILYTGGTTGMPKGVLWRQDDIYVAAMGGRVIGGVGELADFDAVAESARNGAGGQRLLCVPPLMHGAAQWAMYNTFTSGGTMLFADAAVGLDAAAIIDLVAREKVVTILAVGDAIARPLVEEIEVGGRDLSSLFVMVNGGAIMSPSLKERLLQALPSMMVFDAVGSSETGAQMTHVSSAAQAATSGTFNAGPDTVVIDADMSRLLSPDQTDIGWLGQAGRVPLGYLGDAEKTRRTFPVIDGVRYAIPGDRARYNESGAVELLGRDSVTINSGGEKIFAEEVEQSIAGHPAVYDVVVVGRPSERWGNEVVALVQAHPNMTLTQDDVLEESARHIARYKLPKAVLFLDKLQRSPAGKADYSWAKRVAAESSPT